MLQKRLDQAADRAAMRAAEVSGPKTLESQAAAAPGAELETATSTSAIHTIKSTLGKHQLPQVGICTFSRHDSIDVAVCQGGFHRCGQAHRIRQVAAGHARRRPSILPLL